jgi:DNA topoisomerase-2
LTSSSNSGRSAESLVALDVHPHCFPQKSYEAFEKKIATNGKAVKRKQTSLRKSLGRTQQSDDSEDDFKPSKATAKAKKPLPPSKPSKSAATKKSLNSDSDGPQLLKPKTLTKKPPKTDKDSNAMVVEKQVPEKRPAVAHEISSDSDVVVKPSQSKGKGKVKEAPAPKRKRSV